MTTFINIFPWLWLALCVGFTVYQFISLARFTKLCRQRTAVYKAAVAASNRGDQLEFDFLHQEWQRLAAECERQMGIKKADATNPFRSTPL